MSTSDITEVSLQRTSPIAEKKSASSIKFDTENGIAYIDLDVIRNNGAKSASSQVALGHVISAIKDGSTWVVVKCGTPTKALFGYNFSKQGQQVLDDANELASQASLDTIGTRINKTVKSTKTGGNAGEKPISVVFEVQ